VSQNDHTDENTQNIHYEHLSSTYFYFVALKRKNF
jgi:hypothetical protein